MTIGEHRPASRLFWVPDISDPTEPTPAELADGIELTGYFTGPLTFESDPGPSRPFAMPTGPLALTLTVPRDPDSVVLAGLMRRLKGWGRRARRTRKPWRCQHGARRPSACRGCHPHRNPPPAPHATDYHRKTRRKARR